MNASKSLWSAFRSTPAKQVSKLSGSSRTLWTVSRSRRKAGYRRRMKVHLVDGTFELFRCFHATPRAQAEDGREVGAARGLVQTMVALLRPPEVGDPSDGLPDPGLGTQVQRRRPAALPDGGGHPR